MKIENNVITEITVRDIKKGQLIIPDGATAIARAALTNDARTKVVTVVIPDGFMEIGGGAFYDCTGLESLILPNGITHIGDCAFSACAGLKSLTLPDSIMHIGREAFRGCVSLKSLTLPNTITHIGDGAFRGCTELASITLHDSITHIGAFAFYGCAGLKSLTLPNSITHIGIMAFKGCTGLESLVLPDSVTDISDSAFYGCTGLKSLILSDNIMRISNDAFGGCAGLKSLTLPDGITRIGGAAFQGCVGLESLTLPDGVTHIGCDAFADCAGLKEVVLPDSLEHISYSVFCDSVEKISYRGIAYRIKKVDGCEMAVHQQRTRKEITIFKGRFLNSLTNDSKRDIFLVEQNGVYAHGNTLKEAMKNLHFKVMKKRGAGQYKGMSLDDLIPLEDAKIMYRIITSDSHWRGFQELLDLFAEVKEEYTVRELIELTRIARFGKKFAKFFEKNCNTSDNDFDKTNGANVPANDILVQE